MKTKPIFLCLALCSLSAQALVIQPEHREITLTEPRTVYGLPLPKDTVITYWASPDAPQKTLQQVLEKHDSIQEITFPQITQWAGYQIKRVSFYSVWNRAVIFTPTLPKNAPSFFRCSNEYIGDKYHLFMSPIQTNQDGTPSWRGDNYAFSGCTTQDMTVKINNKNKVLKNYDIVKKQGEWVVEVEPRERNMMHENLSFHMDNQGNVTSFESRLSKNIILGKCHYDPKNYVNTVGDVRFWTFLSKQGWQTQLRRAGINGTYLPEHDRPKNDDTDPCFQANALPAATAEQWFHDSVPVKGRD